MTLATAAAAAETKATFTLASGVTVEITEAPFDKKQFKISGCTETSPHCLIDGRLPFGARGVLPKTYVKRISASYEGRTYLLNARDMYDAWGDRPLEEKGVIRYFGGKCFDQTNCQFRGVFSDGTGTFVAGWPIVDGVPMRTVLTGDEDVVRLFEDQIDPPEYH